MTLGLAEFNVDKVRLRLSKVLTIPLIWKFWSEFQESQIEKELRMVENIDSPTLWIWTYLFVTRGTQVMQKALLK